MASSDKFNSSRKYGIESGAPEIGTRLGVSRFLSGKYAVQSGVPEIGSFMGVNGGMSPTAVIPGATCGYEFWTCKQAYLYEEFEGAVIVGDSSIQLLHLTLSGAVKNSIDLDPVIFSIIKNIQIRADTYERVAVAPHWVNPYYYDRYASFEPSVAPVSLTYSDIPRSTSTKTTRYVSGDPTLPSSYIRPASYAGPLGPVYAGVTSTSDVNNSPWNQTKGPCDPCNIQVRDIKLDANDNLWVILQMGWEYDRVYLSRQSGMFYNQELGTWIGYEDTGSNPNVAYFYNTGSFSRQYNPSGDITRAGPIRPRIFIVCFDKQTNYKTWDYLPFRPGTRGFNKISREANSRGPAIYGITVPPSRLDADPYGNIYYSVGTADIWEGTPSSGNLHCYGIAKNEIGYLYVKPFTQAAQTVSEGLDVGRMGPYPSQCTFMAYDQNTMAYYNHEIGRTDRPAFRAPWTWNIGGDRTVITKWKSAVNSIETWYVSTFGNATAFRATFLINRSQVFPHPYVSTPAYWGPCEIRATDNEWLTSNPALKCANRDTDLLFAACDYLTRNYSYLASPTTYNCNNWLQDEVKWAKGLNEFTQLHPQKDMWFEVGGGDTEPFTGWKPSESPGFWYTHFTVKSGIMMEMGCRSYAITDTRGSFTRGFLPLFGAISYLQDTFFRVASTPYSQGYASSTDFYEKNGVAGMMPTCLSRLGNEKTIIIPKFDFKHEILSFSGQTWDTYDAIRKKFGTYTNAVAWPWRWHSMVMSISQASMDTLDSSKYGPRASYLDPASMPMTGDYEAPAIDKVYYYDDSWAALWADVADKMDRPAVVTALNGMNRYITSAKWHYWESGLTNLNFGAFCSAVNCSDTVGFFVPRYQIGVTFYDNPDTGDYTINVVTDTRPLKRLYLITVNKKADLTWGITGTPGTKTWYQKIVDWINPSNPTQVIPPVTKSKYYDFGSGQISTLKNWDPTATVEKYQQICFINWRIKEGIESPQFY